MKRLILVLLMFTLLASLSYADLMTRGELRTRMALFYDIGADEPTQSYTDSRFQMTFENRFSDYLTAVWKVQVGDLVWGREGAAFRAGDNNVKTQNLYLGFLCPITGVDAKIGIQEWRDKRSLVLNDDQAPFAGIMLNKDIGNDWMLELGTAKLEKDEFYRDNDVDLFFINIGKPMLGLDNIIQRWNYGDNIDAWIMPYFDYTFNDLFDLLVMAAYNYSSYTEYFEDGADKTNNGFAFSIKAAYDLQPLVLGLDFLLTTGDDASDPTSTSEFNTIYSFYNSGLEILGRGVHTGVFHGPDPGNDGDGLISVALSGSYPVDEELTLKGTLGFLNAMESTNAAVTNATEMGIEINLGLNYKLYENLSFDLVGAMLIPGEYFHPDPDNTLALVSRFLYKF